MKVLNKILLTCISGAALIMSSCDYEDKFDNIALRDIKPANNPITCAQLKSGYNGVEDFLITKNEKSEKYADMFTIYRIPNTLKDTINAVVVSTDVDGNTYKKIVLRDLTDGSALDISVDASGLSAVWPQGQQVIIMPGDLYIGDYANSTTVGSTSYNIKKDRYEVGRLPFKTAEKHIVAVGLPDKSLVNPIDVTIEDINKRGSGLIGQLVRIKNVRFGYFVENDAPSNFQQDKYKLIDDTKENIVFSEENDLDVPVSRAIVDNDKNVTSVTTSFYAKFASELLPQGKHDIIAIVGWYRDQASRAGNYQLTVQRFSEITAVEEDEPTDE